MFKFTKQAGSDGIYTVTVDGEERGRVARVGYNRPATWAAYVPGEELKGPRFAYGSRLGAAYALQHYSETGNYSQRIAPSAR
jgi:hypothetical protein